MRDFLDAGPMIRAFGETPDAFEMRHNCVVHRPSRHWLGFDPEGNACIMARCDCAELSVTREQSEQLAAAVVAWQESYWRPLLAREAAERRVARINLEFARHFRPRNKLRRALDAVLSGIGIGAARPAFHIDPALPEDHELRAGPPPVREPARKELIRA